MNLTIDIGNTCTKLVAFDGASPVEEVRVDDNEWHKLSSFCQKYTFECGIYSTVVNLSEEKIKTMYFLTPTTSKLTKITNRIWNSMKLNSGSHDDSSNNE